MALRLLGCIDLPNRSNGGFDHADIHLQTARLCVADTANDAVDVIDVLRDASSTRFYPTPNGRSLKMVPERRVAA
jgi:hypothetical protein